MTSMQEEMVEAQVGADPGQAHPVARLQWSTLSRARARSLHVDAATGALDVLGLLAAKVCSCVSPPAIPHVSQGLQLFGFLGVATPTPAHADRVAARACCKWLIQAQQKILSPAGTQGMKMQNYATPPLFRSTMQVLACVVADTAWAGAVPGAWPTQALLGVLLCGPEPTLVAITQMAIL